MAVLVYTKYNMGFIIEVILYFIFDFLLEPLGIGVRWLFFRIIGKPHTMDELMGNRKERKEGKKHKGKKKNNEDWLEGYGCLNNFLGFLVLIGIIAGIVYLINKV